MNQPFLETLARLASGMAATRAPFPSPAAKSAPHADMVGAEGKKRKKRKKARASGNQALEVCQSDLAECNAQAELCAAQEETCRTFVTAACGSDPGCAAIIDCCSALGVCSTTGFLGCLAGAVGPDDPEDSRRRAQAASSH